MSEFAAVDMDRRIANLIRIGTVASVDTASNPPTAVVSFEDLTTDSLPFRAPRAGQNRKWDPPEVGEQVLVLSPSGEMNQGIIIGAIYQDAFPANGDSVDVERTTYKDGTIVEYDRAAHRLTVDASASNGHVVVNVGTGSVDVTCATATVTASDSATVKAANIVTLDAPETTVTGHMTVEKGLSVTNTSGASAVITGNMTLTGGELTVDGIGVKAHHHTEHDGPSTSPAVA